MAEVEDSTQWSPPPSRRHNPSSRPLLKHGSSPPRLPRVLRPLDRFLHRRFKLILSLLFLCTLLIIMVSFSSMSSAPSQLLRANNHLFADDIHVWARFPKLKKYYAGLYTLVNDDANVPEYPPTHVNKAGGAEDRGQLGALKKSRVFDPYPKYTSPKYREMWEGEYKECSFGKGRARPEIRVFDGVPEGMPQPAWGSHEVLGLDGGVCFERYGRFGSYGYGYSEKEGGLGEAMFDGGEREKQVETAHGVGGFPLKKVDWRGVDWGVLQKECGELNKGRFGAIAESGKPPSDSRPHRRVPQKKTKKKKKLPRTAVLLRTWTGYKWSPNNIANVRSLISELSLLSGGEYTVHILVQVRRVDAHIWESPEVYQQELEKSGLPKEFLGLAELWHEEMMALLYPDIYDSSPEWRTETHLPDDKLFLRMSVHGVYRSTFMPVQWFSQRHPEYDFVWNWEMDIRYTGHWYHLFQRLDQWTAAQPRHGLWERSGRFYVPAFHGTWEEFAVSTAGLSNNTGVIFGPVAVKDVTPILPVPEDGTESADLITLNPLFDPEKTSWILRNDITGYPSSTPRRAAIITASRLSRRLLSAMHTENVAGHAAFSEMWPATVALHHGLKAVFAPHPVFVDRWWPTGFLERTFNNGKNGFAGGRRESVFGKREHNFKGSTWYYNAKFPAELYKGWALGKKGEEGEVDRLERGGRMCLKAMLLHPIKS
ncbi:hypothetical protein FN846DRAFT_907020 [Sphaerosporella brunnea]|uniref:Uncharacterized protein n=1 Tax=Sphaerosporella brunnea TaxID=1250544 RepID=A0A5J5EXG6_9PEZI|nr:hypothetical protein FN846DRAFT_907020 [Sphaerosporella brunnea]